MPRYCLKAVPVHRQGVVYFVRDAPGCCCEGSRSLRFRAGRGIDRLLFHALVAACFRLLLACLFRLCVSVSYYLCFPA